MKILFFGTPRFAEIVLQGLLDSEFEVVGVVCQNDKPAGRGNKMVSPHIVTLARENGVPVYQFEKLSQHIDDFKAMDYDLAVTASYGKILPKAFLDINPCVNVHPSLLPKYRGATPIQTALLNGDKITGVTIMKTEVGMDDGDIFVQEKMEVLPEDDYTTLLDKLANVGLRLLLDTLRKIDNGTAVRTKQNDSDATFVKLIKKEDGLLDFSQSAESLVNKVRAFVESPVAHFYLGGDLVKVYKAQVGQNETTAEVGQIIKEKKRLFVKAQDGFFEILRCQAAG
ncbi:MAG: methionyl-tRNA formyltransferase [Clostridia bacterium]|nr:methionyl-tRNA formyltransferase [Clostridia bacterium]